MDNKRKRYQNGSLTIEKRKTGPAVWVYRWRELQADGTTVKRKKIIGTKAELPSLAAAKRALDGLRVEINRQQTDSSSLTIGEVAAHYLREELARSATRTALTCKVYRHHIDKQILPRWRDTNLAELTAVQVERWLEASSAAPATKAKTRNVFSSLYRHAIRQGWIENNPIHFVRQSAKRSSQPDVLTPEEIKMILARLQEPARCIVLVAAMTGMRRGELFGLKWEDVDFANGIIRVSRSLVDQIEGQPKTLTSRRPLPMTAALANALQEHRSRSAFSTEADWVFASPNALGRKPLWPDAVLKRHVVPAVQAASISKKVGWHTFRRTAATLLLASGASVKVSQELLGHASPMITLGTYAQAVGDEKRRAQRKLESLFFEEVTEQKDAA